MVQQQFDEKKNFFFISVSLKVAAVVLIPDYFCTKNVRDNADDDAMVPPPSRCLLGFAGRFGEKI